MEVIDLLLIIYSLVKILLIIFFAAFAVYFVGKKLMLLNYKLRREEKQAEFERKDEDKNV